jgi:tRNA A58 N-methylase Trm61
MTPPRPTELAHTILRGVICVGDTVVDATCGNGHDTVFLAECVGTNGKVIAYDIQAQAIASAQQAISDASYTDRVQWHQKSHVTMADDLAAETASAILFNLGYLPGDDHQVTTKADETLKALETACSLLKPNGTLSIVCYPGHDEGSCEAIQVETWISQLVTQRWRIAKYAMLGTQRPAPFLLLATKPN